MAPTVLDYYAVMIAHATFTRVSSSHFCATYPPLLSFAPPSLRKTSIRHHSNMLLLPYQWFHSIFPQFANTHHIPNTLRSCVPLAEYAASATTIQEDPGSPTAPGSRAIKKWRHCHLKVHTLQLSTLYLAYISVGVRHLAEPDIHRRLRPATTGLHDRVLGKVNPAGGVGLKGTEPDLHRQSYTLTSTTLPLPFLCIYVRILLRRGWRFGVMTDGAWRLPSTLRLNLLQRPMQDWPQLPQYNWRNAIDYYICLLTSRHATSSANNHKYTQTTQRVCPSLGVLTPSPTDIL
jgi:hypothetical protein